MVVMSSPSPRDVIRFVVFNISRSSRGNRALRLAQIVAVIERQLDRATTGLMPAQEPGAVVLPLFEDRPRHGLHVSARAVLCRQFAHVEGVAPCFFVVARLAEGPLDRGRVPEFAKHPTARIAM